MGLMIMVCFAMYWWWQRFKLLVIQLQGMEFFVFVIVCNFRVSGETSIDALNLRRNEKKGKGYCG